MVGFADDVKESTFDSGEAFRFASRGGRQRGGGVFSNGGFGGLDVYRQQRSIDKHRGGKLAEEIA